MQAESILSLTDVQFAWPGRDGFKIGVKHFGLNRGTSTLLLGASGSGKSTLLSLIAGIAQPQTGSVEVAGTDISKLTPRARDRFRAEHLGVIFQMFNLLPYGSVVDNVVLPLSFAPDRRSRVKDPEKDARKLLSSLGIGDDIIGKRAGLLSVGQQQRVAAARALIGKPEVIIADEPTSALDRDRQHAFLDLVFAQVRQAGSTLLMVSHDESLAAQFDNTQKLTDVVSRI